ncbi:MAG: dephospho-CoA kinase [Christensenellaceae bacterium]|jgi:dephospho-CoA kinase
MIIGLMGNSGAGKSQVAEYLKEKGALIIDADELSREVCGLGQPGLKKLQEIFEPYFFNDDGSMNRKRMGRYVFANPAELKKLESVIHPIVWKRVEEEIARPDHDLKVIDSAILIKSGLNKLTDEVWLVMADLDKKLDRISTRDGITVEEAMNRLKNQNDETILTRYADKIIDNNGTHEQLIAQVEEYLGACVKQNEKKE